MAFKTKAAVLSALILVLALVYVVSLVLDSGVRSGETFAWLDPALCDTADRIEIAGSGGVSVLARKNNVWVSAGQRPGYPVKQSRVEDFLGALSGSFAYPLRASSALAAEKLGLGEGTASRIVIRGGAGLPLLDLLVGGSDALGKEVYLKRAGKKEIYSGEDRFTLYTESKPASWYDLRLFPRDNPGKPGSWKPGGRNPGSGKPPLPGTVPASYLTVDSVQQAAVKLPADTENSPGVLPRDFTLRRQNNGWVMPENGNKALDTLKVEAWLRSVLDTEADDFADVPPEAVEGSITLWFGDGSSRTIQTGPADDANRRIAAVSGSSLVYVLSESAVSRLFPEFSSFAKTAQP